MLGAFEIQFRREIKPIVRYQKMAVKAKGGLNKTGHSPGAPKKSRQGLGNGTKYSATSRNKPRKPYRGQGK